MIIAAKFAVGVLALLLGVALSRSSTVTGLDDRQFRRLMWVVWLITRGGLFVGLYLVLRQPLTSDLGFFYYPQALHALQGEIVYRDFPSSYSPLFPYVLGAGLRVWSSPYVLVLMAIVAEGLSLSFWMAAAAKTIDRRTRRDAVLYYVTSALPMVNVAVEGHNQVWVAVFFGAAFWLVAIGRPRLAALTLGVMFVVVKLLALLGVPAYLCRGDRRWIAAIWFAVLPALVFGGLLAGGVDVLMPLRLQGSDQTSGNLPFLVNALLGTTGRVVPALAIDALALLVLGAVVVWLVLRGASWPSTAILWGLVLIHATFMLVSKKSYSSYLVMAFFPACILAASARRPWFGPAAFGLFGFVAMIERSLWFRWLHNAPPAETLGELRATGVVRALLFVCVEGVLLAGYVWLWRESRARLATTVGPVFAAESNDGARL